jgi:hypothetical protein
MKSRRRTGHASSRFTNSLSQSRHHGNGPQRHGPQRRLVAVVETAKTTAAISITCNRSMTSEGSFPVLTQTGH